MYISSLLPPLGISRSLDFPPILAPASVEVVLLGRGRASRRRVPACSSRLGGMGANGTAAGAGASGAAGRGSTRDASSGSYWPLERLVAREVDWDCEGVDVEAEDGRGRLLCAERPETIVVGVVRCCQGGRRAGVVSSSLERAQGSSLRPVPLPLLPLPRLHQTTAPPSLQCPQSRNQCRGSPPASLPSDRDRLRALSLS